MAIPEKASMAPARTTPSAAELLAALVHLTEQQNKQLNYIITNIFELAKAVNNVERAIDRAASHIVGYRE